VDIQDQDMKIRELFRQTLENAEVIPDPAVGVNLMKRVGRQEFLRFDPSRFNVYYLGVVLVAAITAGVLFSTGGTETAQLVPSETKVMTTDSVGTMDTLTAGQEKITPQDKEEKIAEPSAVVMAKPSAVKNDKAAHKDSTNDSAASIPVKENIEKKSAPVNRETEYLKFSGQLYQKLTIQKRILRKRK
jgi:hypothetical protein